MPFSASKGSTAYKEVLPSPFNRFIMFCGWQAISGWVLHIFEGLSDHILRKMRLTKPGLYSISAGELDEATGRWGAIRANATVADDTRKYCWCR